MTWSHGETTTNTYNEQYQRRLQGEARGPWPPHFGLPPIWAKLWTNTFRLANANTVYITVIDLIHNLRAEKFLKTSNRHWTVDMWHWVLQMSCRRSTNSYHDRETSLVNNWTQRHTTSASLWRMSTLLNKPTVRRTATTTHIFSYLFIYLVFNMKLVHKYTVERDIEND